MKHSRRNGRCTPETSGRTAKKTSPIASSAKSLSKNCLQKEADITAGDVAKPSVPPVLKIRKKYPKPMPMSMKYVTSVTLISLIRISRET